MSGVRLSPEGTHIVAIRPYNGRDNLVVFDLATRKSLIITNFRDADVRSVLWVTNDRLLLTLYDRQRGRGDQLPGGMFSIRRDGSEYLTLAERSFVSDGSKLLPAGADLHSLVRDKDGKPTDEIIVDVPRGQGRGRFDSVLYRVNVATGRFTLLDLSGAPKSVVSWVLDRNYVPRVAVTVGEDGETQLHTSEGAKSPWRKLLGVAQDAVEKTVTPLAFDAAGTLYVAAYAGTDYQGIYKFDTKTGQTLPEPVVAAKGFDIEGGLVFTRRGDKLLGVQFDADKPVSVWFDPDLVKLQAAVDRLLPGTVNKLQIPGEEFPTAPVLITSISDRDPGRYFLLDRQTEKLSSVGASRPWVKPEQMQPTRFYRYEAHDGLSIPAQLTLPTGKGPFPLVVLHYGGPWVRPIHGEWDGNVQFLVSRGYAVFMPAPRASRGFGHKLFKAGWKQWGLGMQDDVTVGVRKLIAEGIIDAKRVALAGASYGGYLTMMGLVKEPELFRCGINWVGVTDPSFMFTVTWTDFNQAESGRFDLPLLIGDPEKDKEQFQRTSPVLRAAEIKQPVLMAYGGADRRVPIVNGERMREALKPHNKQVEWVVYPDEGHGWQKLENTLDFWGRVERFLAQNLKA